MLTPLAGCAAALLMACWLRPLLRWLRVLRMARSFPGPPAWPLLGNLLDLRGDAHHTFNFMVTLGRTYGDFARVWAGPKLMVVLSDPRDIRRVLTDQRIVNHDASMTDALTPFIANGLFTARDSHWKVHRKLVAASFTPRQLQRYVPALGANADALCRKLEALSSATVADFRQMAALCTMDAICQSAIGVQTAMQSGEDLDFYEGVVEGMELVHNRVVRPWLLISWLYPWTSDGRAAARRKKQLSGFTERLACAQPSAQPPCADTCAAADDEVCSKPLRTLVQVLRDVAAQEDRAAGALTVSDIRDEMTTTAAAGFESTALTICNLLLLVGLHPAVQDEIAREQDEVFGGDLRPASLADLRRMDYLSAVLQETLRLIPVVPTLSREIAEDVALPSGRTLPAGCTCLVFSYAVHRDARHFAEPESFVPDRWRRHRPPPPRFAYLPFGGGHRDCVGAKFAALQVKAIVSSLLRRFRVSHRRTEAEIGAQALGISMSMTTPYEITFSRRQLATQRLLDAVD